MDVKVVRFLLGFFPDEVSASCIKSGRLSGSEESAERNSRSYCYGNKPLLVVIILHFFSLPHFTSYDEQLTAINALTLYDRIFNGHSLEVFYVSNEIQNEKSMQMGMLAFWL